MARKKKRVAKRKAKRKASRSDGPKPPREPPRAGLVTTAELMRLLKITETPFRKKRAAGLEPDEVVGRQHWWDPKRVRKWHREREQSGGRKGKASAALDEAAGLSEDERGARAAIEDRLRSAQTTQELAGIAAEVAACVAQGTVNPTIGRAIKELIQETRQNLTNKAPQEAGAGPVLYATQEGAELLAVFEKILNGRRRRSIMELAYGELEEDREDFPDEVKTKPEQVTEALGRLGLNAWGEPQEED